jgi:hypothetical protein
VVVGTSTRVAHRVQSQRARTIALTLLLASVWPLLWVFANGSTDALLGVGVDGGARPAVQQEIPDLHLVKDAGHDGQQYYVIARHPFDPQAAAPYLDRPEYRYRRILFPLLAGALAPDGGRRLIVAFAVVSLAGVALGAWALSELDGAPRWLPLSLAVTPAVITSLQLSLADSLATCIALAAVLAVQRRRLMLALIAVTLAALTRETFLIVPIGLAFAPSIPPRWRLLLTTVPTGFVGAWSWWCARQVGAPLLGRGGDQLALPPSGWVSPHVGAGAIAIGSAAALLLGTAAWRSRKRAPHVAVVLGLQLLLLLCLADVVAFSWRNSLCTATPLLPLAIWQLVTATRHSSSSATSV